jgi:hypothetical protein
MSMLMKVLGECTENAICWQCLFCLEAGRVSTVQTPVVESKPVSRSCKCGRLHIFVPSDARKKSTLIYSHSDKKGK